MEVGQHSLGSMAFSLTHSNHEPGHYGPGFASYFEDQNAAIATGSVKGEKIDLVALGVSHISTDRIEFIILIRSSQCL